MSVLHGSSALLSQHPWSRVAVAKQHAVVTVGDDGVACYDLSSNRRTEAIPLGSSIGLSLPSPAVFGEAEGLFYALVDEVEEAQPHTTSASGTPSASTTQRNYLVCWPSSNSSSSRKKQPASAPPPPRTLADITPRIPLPGAAHSVHALRPSSLNQTATAVPAAAAGTYPHAPSDSLPAHAFAAVVLTDGRVGWAGGALELSMVLSPSLSPDAGPLVAACGAGSMLLTLHHSSPRAMLRAYVARQTLSGPVLTHARDTPIPCPSHATPVSLHLAPTYSLVVWSTGATTVVQLSTSPSSPGPAHPPKLLHFSPPPSITSAVTANHLLPAGATEPGAHAGANGDTSSTPSASARKRKAPSTDGTLAGAAGPASPSPFLAAPVDDTQLIVACVCPALASTASAASHELQYAVLERQFGVVMHTGSLPLEGMLGASASQPRLLSHPEGSPGTLVLQLEQALAQARLKQQPPPLSTLQQAADAVAAAYHYHYQQQQQQQQQEQLQPSQLEGQGQQGYQVRQQQQPGHRGRSSVGSSSAKKAGMGGDGPSCSLLAASRLAPLVALACAEGERWEMLRGLLQVVQVLLAPTQATNLEARRAYHRQLRAAAEAEVQHAEQQLQGLAPGPSASGAGAMAVDGADGEEQDEDEVAASRRSALAHAHCAAAAVDGFALHEVLLHVPLALHADVAGLQACVRQLSNAQVDRLLTYLAKWVGKYSQGPLAQLAGSNAAYIATMPPVLMFPLFSQVESCQQLLPLQGAIEHVRAGAPLPHAHVAASTMYTVEYVDLGLPVPS
ncbi:hypothetical protein DUNSADRAFT_8243 [Dunaliella salina]|uniref:Uncharacterized protein n=1 Tax=Dunaliella salina TaxID=3046 RepID=A0ABQ7HA49_DUNSA|nr:hypothetical protein DUNSADRAFT_8243 [Dunaliella salina]|eukprot:KAF5843728.1 hypothetical protein DUNSADRAFT_8243 [Dunaliella salina]